MKNFSDVVKSVMIGESQSKENLNEGPGVNWAFRAKEIEMAIPVLKGNQVDSSDEGDSATFQYDLSKAFGKAFKDFIVTVYAQPRGSILIDIDATTASNQGLGTDRPFKANV